MNDRKKVREKSELLKIRAFQKSKYDQYALTSMTAYCIFWLQEWNIPTSLENIAIASHRLFPVKFAMVGWSEFPDITRTNRTVLQMRPKYRNLASSSASQGVFLNQNGIAEAKSLIAKIGPPIFEGEDPIKLTSADLKAERGSGKARTIHPEDIVAKVRKSQLFDLYTHSRFDEAEAIHLIGMLDVYDHTPSTQKRKKLKEFIDAASELGDKTIFEFLNQVESRFADYLKK